jgi:hypothetical protein
MKHKQNFGMKPMKTLDHKPVRPVRVDNTTKELIGAGIGLAVLGIGLSALKK